MALGPNPSFTEPGLVETLLHVTTSIYSRAGARRVVLFPLRSFNALTMTPLPHGGAHVLGNSNFP